MERIRIALGEDKLTFIGHSAGTLLGAVYADRYPQRVRAFVLDGPIDPNLTLDQMTLAQAKGFEAALRSFFAYCDKTATCQWRPANPDRTQALLALMDRVRQEPLKASGGRIVGVDDFVSGIMSRLTARSKWASLGDALAAAERGDGSPLATLASNYQNAGASNAADARQSILCLDHPAPRELSAYPPLAEASKAHAPVFGPVFTWAALSCGMWSVPATLEVKPTRAAGAPPIMVVGTTGDPATPQAWAEALAGQFERGVLVLRQGAEHVAYYYSACVRRLVDAYIDRRPATGLGSRLRQLRPVHLPRFRVSRSAWRAAEFHESEERLRPQTMDYHRAIVSLMEELEAVDWYDQRIDASDDPELQVILTHNRDEEKEHAAMTLEWLRRRDPELDRVLRQYLFTEGSITAIEEATERSRERLAKRQRRDARYWQPAREERPMSASAPGARSHLRERLDSRSRTRRPAPCGPFSPHADSSTSPAPTAGTTRPTSLGRLERDRRGRSTGSTPACAWCSRWSSCATPSRCTGADIDDIDRGRPDPDLSKVVEAAKRAALAEDTIVFEGFKEAHITGIAEASPYPPVEIDDNYAEYPRSWSPGRCRRCGRPAIDGPYTAVLGPHCWTGVIETTEYGGYPVLEHLRLILGGPVVWAPAVDGAVVVSTRGGDFQLTCGEDLSLGYISHGPETVQLFLEESIGFRVLTPRRPCLPSPRLAGRPTGRAVLPWPGT